MVRVSHVYVDTTHLVHICFIYHFQVTTVETPSPVSVIRHSPPPPLPPLSSVSGTHGHRFSSDFVHPSSFKEHLSSSKSAAVAARGKPSLSLAQHIEEGMCSTFH